MLIQYFLSIAVTLPLHVTVIHCDYGKKRRRKKKRKKGIASRKIRVRFLQW